MKRHSEKQRDRRYITINARDGVRVRSSRGGLTHDTYFYFLNTGWPQLFLTLSVVYIALNVAFAILFVLGGDTIGNATPGSIADAFFFSIQTMATIGFGYMYPKTHYANVLVTIESFLGLMLVAMSTGLMFAKFSVPRARVLFSKNLVMTRFNGKPVLRFRLANERGNQILEARITLVVLRDEVSAEGERMRRLIDLAPDRSMTPVFALSWVVTHVVDETSPLFGETEASLAAKNTQVIITFVGIDDSSGQTVHSRHMYMFGSILWNHRFVDIIGEDTHGRFIDFDNFHLTEPSRIQHKETKP